MTKEIKVCIGTDIDAVAGWIGSYGGQDSPADIQRGMFAGEVGIPRLLRLFEKYGIYGTFFAPGHSIETFPHRIEQIVEAGHELGAHGYTHENPIAMTAAQEEDVINKSISLIEKFSGQKPRGYIAPWCELSSITTDLLLKNGFTYDHSQAFHDFQPFYARTGDTWTNIDYSKDAADWMKPLVRGKEIDLVEINFSWYIDDLPPMMFIKGSPNSHGFVNPHDVEQLWRDQFDWVYREYDYAIFPITIHPDVSGRPQVLLMLERLFDHIQRHPGVTFEKFEDVASDFRQRFPFEENKLYPFDRDMA
ncbi:polysaccharide deacetylase family protein [Cryobacterium ruanii]|uniref:Polysaccharide deacetylase n=1 Tax=Cryobacterium ruanii TaxID=1259197 RepID=A0A4R9AL76_9MICO|nr:polysaccharide deacetylase [Cryobacterium ruanii]TFD64457.1 polysaccharide deacetylase [Cryobacterium ruanii]